MSQTGQEERHLTPHSSLLSSISSDFVEGDQIDEMALTQERKQNFQSACTLKALSPVLEVVAHEKLNGMPDGEAADLAREIVLICRRQSSEVCVALELSEESVAWGRSYFAGAIAEQIAKIWPQARKKTLTINWSKGLCEVGKPLLMKGIPPTWKNTDLSVSLSATTMTAMQSLMQQYDVFTMFHRNREDVQERFSSLLISESMRQVDFVTETFPLSDDSKCSLAQSLIKNGGGILSSLWEARARMAVSAYQNRANEAEKKQYRSNGFPLEDLEASFIDQMEVLGRLSVKSMNIARGAEQQEHSTSAGMT